MSKSIKGIDGFNQLLDRVVKAGKGNPNHDSRGRFSTTTESMASAGYDPDEIDSGGEVDQETGEAASGRANELSAEARRTRTANDHERAARAHQVASEIYKKLGNPLRADYHANRAQYHKG